MKKFLFAALIITIATRAFAQQAAVVSGSDTVKGGLTKSGAASASYAAGRLSMTPTTTKQTQGKTFGEKVAGGLQSGANAVVTGVSSIGGISKSGGAVSSSYAAGRLSMTPTTTRQTQGTNFGEKISAGNPLYESGNQSGVNPMHGSSSMARPGTPIGGIVVKGGKNPGGNMTITISNERGIFELIGLEPGSYQFTLITPDAPQERSISEKGVKRQETAQTETRTYTGGRKNALQENSIDEKDIAAPEQSIGGIVVKGGKDQGGAMTSLQVSENGEIRFEVLEAGNYQFIIQVAEDAHQNNTNQEKVVEKATSGLKDTLKTNV